jgi:hypothetical protein
MLPERFFNFLTNTVYILQHPNLQKSLVISRVTAGVAKKCGKQVKKTIKKRMKFKTSSFSVGPAGLEPATP